jgi:ketosteroid isomerase-like protein
MARWLWMAGLAMVVAAAGANARESAIDSLVRAERAFARMSVTMSQRDAFLANFADDGVWFSPGPENTKETLRKQPAPAGPPSRLLDWEPATGDAAESGDLGYTTGPYRSTSKVAAQPVATGWFFSVWRWRADVQWKVVADFGIECAEAGPLRPRTFRRADVRGVSPRVKPGAGVSADELRAADAAFAEEAGRSGLQAAYRERSTKDLLIFRRGSAPIGGRLAVLSVTSSAPMRLALQPSHAEASRAGDLGFTYGAYTIAAAGGGEQKGYFLHVWKRQADGWKLAADVTNQ